MPAEQRIPVALSAVPPITRPHGYVPPIVTAREFAVYRETQTGYCTSCRDWTTDVTAPDAFGYQCDDCDRETVIGADVAEDQNLILVERE
jgi:hypothetical protein